MSSFLVIIKSSSLRSNYICPTADSTATAIPFLQFLGFLLDCVIVQIAYRLIDDGISEADDWTIHLPDGTSNHLLVGLTLTVSQSPSCIITHLTLNRHLLWSFSSPALSYTPQCLSIASGCSRFRLNISLVFCVYR